MTRSSLFVETGGIGCTEQFFLKSNHFAHVVTENQFGEMAGQNLQGPVATANSSIFAEAHTHTHTHTHTRTQCVFLLEPKVLSVVQHFKRETIGVIPQLPLTQERTRNPLSPSAHGDNTPSHWSMIVSGLQPFSLLFSVHQAPQLGSHGAQVLKRRFSSLPRLASRR